VGYLLLLLDHLHVLALLLTPEVGLALDGGEPCERHAAELTAGIIFGLGQRAAAVGLLIEVVYTPLPHPLPIRRKLRQTVV